MEPDDLPSMGADPPGADLADLAAAARVLLRLHADGLLDSPTLASVGQAIATHRRHLTEIRQPADPAARALHASAAPPASLPTPPPPPGPWLERLVTAAYETWSAEDRAQALAGYDALMEDQRATMAPPAQLAVARLLASARRFEAALGAYRRWLAATTASPPQVALEAARFAAEVGRAILDQARAAPLRHDREAEARAHALKAEAEARLQATTPREVTEPAGLPSPPPAVTPPPMTPEPALPLSAPAPTLRPAPAPPAQRLEEFLTTSRALEAWTAEERAQAVAWYDALTDDQRAAMAPPAQLAIARLLASERFETAALGAYRRWLAAPSEVPRVAAVALEAARFAAEAWRRHEALAFLDLARATPLQPDERGQVEAAARALEAELRPEGPATPSPAAGAPAVPVTVPPAASPIAEPESFPAPSLVSAPAGPAFPPFELSAPAPVESPAPGPPPTEPVSPRRGPSVEPVPPPVEPVEPAPPRRSVREVLVAFMEERHILWGELVGGLLIVGCSIALVLSLRQNLERIPYFPFLILASVTAAAFGIGFYSLRRWRLLSTSWGLLVIGTLLVPLCFLALVTLSRGSAWRLAELGISLLALAGFGALVARAAAVLAPGPWWPMPLGVLAPAGSQILALWLLGPEPPAWLVLLVGAVPVASYGAATRGVLGRGSLTGPARPATGADDARTMFGVVGIGAFSVVVALAVLVSQAADVRLALARAALLIVLAGLPALAGGMWIHQGLAEDPGLGVWRTAGTGMALGGAAAMLIALGLAWPEPVWVVLVALVDAAVLTVFAFRAAMPVAHAGAIPCLVLGTLAGFHWLAGDLAGPHAEPGRRLLETLGSAPSAAVLLALAAGLGVAAARCLRASIRTHGLFYIAGSGGAALLSLALATWYAPGHPGLVTVVYAIVAVGVLGANLVWQRPVASAGGLTLLTATSLWALRWVFHGLTPAWGGVLATQALAMGILALLLARRADAEQWVGGAHTYREPLARGAHGVAVLAILAGIASGSAGPWAFAHVVTGAGLLALYGLLATVEGRLVYARVTAAMLLGTVVTGAGWAGRAWGVADRQALMALGLALTSTVLATPAVGAGAMLARWWHGLAVARAVTLSWSAVLTVARREGALAAAALAIAVGVSAPTFPDSGLLTVGSALVAATAFLLAWEYRRPELAWIGSGLTLAALAQGPLWLSLSGREWMLDSIAGRGRPWLFALLGHSTLMLLGSRLREPDSEARRVLIEPIRYTALVSSFLAIPLLSVRGWETLVLGHARAASLTLTWLGAIWLVLAWTERRRWLFAAFLLTLAFAVLAGTVELGWSHAWPYSPWIGLGLLSFAWGVTRLALRASPTAQQLFVPWPLSVDGVVFGLLVIGQLAVAGTHLLRPEPVPGAGGWALLGVLTLALGVRLWDRWGTAELLGLVFLALTVPVLAAQWFTADLAIEAALRWGLAVTFVLGSAAVWLRDPLRDLAIRVGCRIDVHAPLGSVARGALVIGAALPVLALTTVLTNATLWGTPPKAPLVQSFFARVGPIGGNAVPLVLVALGLVGHALRDAAPGYGFAAGLVVNLTVTGGYAFHVALAGRAFDIATHARLVQLAAGMFALWALLWLGALRRGRMWSAGRDAPASRLLLALQVRIGVLGVAGLLAWALAGLTIPVPSRAAWAVEAGSVVGWLAFALAGTATVLHAAPTAVPAPRDAAGLAGLAALGLLACSVERGWPGAGYRALMLGWAASAPAIALGGWAVATARARRAQGGEPGPSAFAEAAARAVGITAGLALLLALKAALLHEDRLGAAASLACAAAGTAALAVWQRREDWALLSGLAVNLAASLLVWDAHAGVPLTAWWVGLMQANVVASAGGALGWLAIRRRLGVAPEMAAGRWLGLQVAGGILAQGLLLAWAVLWLVLTPGAVPPDVGHVGSLVGWLAFALASGAVLWYVRAADDPRALEAATASALGLGIMLASSSVHWDLGQWLAYHALTTAWALAGLGTLALLVPPWGRGVGRMSIEAAMTLRRLATVIAALLVTLALRGAWADPGRPRWSLAATLVASAVMGGLALRFGSPREVYASGLLVSVAGALIWTAGAHPTLLGLWRLQAVCLALASTGWSVLTANRRARGRPLDPGAWPPFSHLAALAALGLSAVRVGLDLAADLRIAPAVEDASGPLNWLLLGATALALLMCLREPDAPFVLPALYAVGLLGVGQALHAAGLRPQTLERAWTLALAGYVLSTSAVWRVAPRWDRLRGLFAISTAAAQRTDAWLVSAQAIVGASVATLALRLALAADARPEAPLATGMLGLAGVLLATDRAHPRQAALRYTTLGLGVLFMGEVLLLAEPVLVPAALLAEPSWAGLDPSAARWLGRSMTLFASLAVTTLVYGIGAGARLTGSAVWSECGRRLAPVLGGLASALLVLVLLQEAALHRPGVGVPMSGVAIGVATIALGGLVAAALWFAVRAGSDPLGLTERGRASYVYAAEVLLALTFVHLRLAAPRVFLIVLAGRYWPWAILAIAYTGVGLGELFRRRRLRVLAEPVEQTGLFLPLLPIVAFWLQPESNYGQYALVWFGSGLLFGALALTRRSTGFALVAGVAANVGLWMVLKHYGIAFLAHPQMWLVPVSLTVLVAGELNREHLTPAQLVGLRHAALLGMYVSSTADLFIAGLGTSVVLPLALAVLSVLGVLAGIALRVRAFLILGTTFLVVVIVAMIWHATVDRQQTWILWASGILLGAAVLALFALFEKRRNDILRVLDEIKHWA